MPTTARSLALGVLDSYQPQKSNLSQVLAVHFSRQANAIPDRGFARDLVWGVVRYLNTIDWFVDHFADEPGRIDPRVRNILRLGVFQILYFEERVPHYAAVNESVELATRAGRAKAGKFVNAVLRNIIRKVNDLPWPPNEDNALKSLAVRNAHPAWLVSRWLDRWGNDETVKLCQANNVVPHLTIRANTLKISAEDLKKWLEAEGVAVEACSCAEDGLVLLSNPEIESLESYRLGYFIVQDEASQLVANVLDPREGETIVDLCSGAGIKTSHIVQLTNQQVRVIAVDNATQQIDKSKQNFQRLGVAPNVETVQADARRFGDFLADRVLVDAPCSGFGVMRRKPDIKWNRSEEDVAVRYPALQKAILFNGARLVKMGGVMVYCTCTTEPEENESVVKEFLLRFPDFRLEEIPLRGPAQRLMTRSKYYFSTLPHRDGLDGFFAVKLRRR
jgi:16S rRNA (cytosine967-C5)-methyltransferase